MATEFGCFNVMKFVSWNVNGLRACLTKGFMDFFEYTDADFFCVGETKMQKGQAEVLTKGYEQYWNSAEKKGYSGTLIFTKHNPISVKYDMGIDDHAHEGRLITLEYKNFYLVNVYTPNSQDGLKRIDYRMKWEDDFRGYLCSLKEKKPTIVCGDMNVAHNEIDLKNPKTNRKNAGFTDLERSKISMLLDSGFIDTYRFLHPDEVKYSWWSYRFNARKNNSGWRIDYFLVSECLKENIVSAKIHNEIFGSDHCPVSLELDISTE